MESCKSLNYNALTSKHHHPYGMMMPNRDWSSESGYRFGFNDKENDTEFNGKGNSYDYGFRIYNSRLGKFISVDPLTKKYVYLTPYQFASNSPIMAVDIDGLEAWVTTGKWSKEDIFKFQNFVQSELNKIDAAAVRGEVSKSTCFDCADLAVHLIIQYASENGRPLEFTDVNGNSIRSQDTKFTSVAQFEDQVRGWTNAASLRNNDMKKVDGNPLIGDMTNSGSHVDIVRPYDEELDNFKKSELRVPTISGTTPNCCDDQGNPIETTVKPFGGVLITKETRYNNVSKSNEFYRWNVLYEPESNLSTEGIVTIKTERFTVDSQNMEIKR